MEATTKIFILARAGHFRDSLLALLKTLPDVELFQVVDEISAVQQQAAGKAPDLLLIDLDGQSEKSAQAIAELRESWSAARCLVLVNSSRQAHLAQQTLKADAMLAKSVSAGEFLAVVRQITRRTGRGAAAWAGSEFAVSYLYALEP